MSTAISAIMLIALLNPSATSGNYTYEKIAKRNADVALSEQEIRTAKMQGECLVGLKELNFKKKDAFDPVAEWTSFRSISLLEQFSPCQVLVMMEIARKELTKKEQQ